MKKFVVITLRFLFLSGLFIVCGCGSESPQGVETEPESDSTWGYDEVIEQAEEKVEEANRRIEEQEREIEELLDENQ